MRDDMHRVVIERPRAGHANRSRKWGMRVDENFEGPAFVSSARRRQYGWNSKELSDLINPLKRYLNKQVGRPWNLVYSEIKKAIPKGMHGDHIWSHIRSYVEIRCWEEGGTLWSSHKYFGPREVSGLYVHPRTGLLCLKRERRSVRSPRPIGHIQLGEGREYRNLDGIWYYREFRPPEADSDNPQWRLVSKKQLNHDELRKLRQQYPSAV